MHVGRRRGEIAISAVLIAIGVFYLWGAWRMPPGSSGVPGPGTVPLAVSVLLILAGAAMIAKALLARSAQHEADAPIEMRLGPGAIVFAALAAVAVAFEYAGFIVTMSLFLFVMLRVFSKLSTLRAAAAAIAITLAAHWFFVSALGVTLPRW